MKTKRSTQTIAVFLAGLMLFASCKSTTMIISDPPGAKLYLNGESAGVTPYQYRDTKIVGSTTDVKLVKEGYADFYTAFSRNEKADAGAIIGGLFLLFPFLWTMKYKPTHTYELIPVNEED
ncbi:PEGA domain-containing protein [Mangrovibacterium lignilyticum]|uniref:PEGA domain-containing protein n=1 Tax=Mangrovibacterium lignilyticum TaxID=2668052 RepID=UPI0013D751D6|nr:PEGA domain-containing protein [Mangrovibacterium lignilyticum]